MTTLRVALSMMILILAIISTLKDSVVLYQATKQWQPNHYMKLFVKDGILYFIVYVSFCSNSVHYCHILPPILLPSAFEKLTSLNL